MYFVQAYLLCAFAVVGLFSLLVLAAGIYDTICELVLMQEG